MKSRQSKNGWRFFFYGLIDIALKYNLYYKTIYTTLRYDTNDNMYPDSRLDDYG